MFILQQPIPFSEPHLYLVYSEYPHQSSANVYLVTGSWPTLIDCGGRASFGQLEANLGQLNYKLSDIKQVIATHGDADHTQGFVEFASRVGGVSLLIHRDDWLPVIEADKIQTKSYLYKETLVPLPADRCIPLSGTQRIAVGDGALLFAHTPGHSAGSSILYGWIDGKRWVFAGDTIGGAMISLDLVGIEVWSKLLQDWHASIAFISQLEFDWILTGHDDIPLSRDQFDRRVNRFGQMFGPWFQLADDIEDASIEHWQPLLTTKPLPILTAAD